MKVKELMTPLNEYLTFRTTATLSDVVMALSESIHRDLLIIDTQGDLKGILTMTDILGALEPNYKKLNGADLDHDTLTHRYVSDILKEFGLWSISLDKLCEEGCKTSVVDAMHVPDAIEYLDEEDSLEQGLHKYVIGVRQPLLVRRNGEITGILRLQDVFEEIRKRMISCACQH